MKNSELIDLLSQYDPDCEVEVLRVESDWGTGPSGNSVETVKSSWKSMQPNDIEQQRDGSIRLGWQD